MKWASNTRQNANKQFQLDSFALTTDLLCSTAALKAGAQSLIIKRLNKYAAVAAVRNHKLHLNLLCVLSGAEFVQFINPQCSILEVTQEGGGGGGAHVCVCVRAQSDKVT